jgi:hypothetical protein
MIFSKKKDRVRSCRHLSPLHPQDSNCFGAAQVDLATPDLFGKKLSGQLHPPFPAIVRQVMDREIIGQSSSKRTTKTGVHLT